MFGWTLASKREISFFAAQIEELRKEKRELLALVEVERRRADAAVNALMLKTNNIAINAVKSPVAPVINEDTEEQFKQAALDIFNDSESLTEQEVIERIQHDRS